MKRKCMLCGRKATCRCRKCGAGYCGFHASLNLVRGRVGIQAALRQMRVRGQSAGPVTVAGLGELPWRWGLAGASPRSYPTRLEPQLRALMEFSVRVEQLEEQRHALLGRLRSVRHDVWRLRQQQGEELSQQLQRRVQLHVEYKGQRAGFTERLSGFFRGSRVDRKSLERIASSEDAVDGQVIAEAARKGYKALEEEFGLTSARAQQIHNYLAGDERRLFELELLYPDDAVRVSLRVNGIQPLERLSVGQRATAMLLLLLAQEDRLLLADQPEDDLDNRFIYEDIVRILRAQKGRRQLFAATHNPNIPVLGHAELIVGLEATESHAFVATQGAIDRPEVREFVKNVMEGGEDAFRRRAEKYGWI